MSRSYIAKALREQIATDARHRCGYCLTSARIIGAPREIDHIIPESLDGQPWENLWLACSMCNDHKGNRIAAPDPRTGEVVRLFDPRRQVWSEHFEWSMEGDVNRAELVEARRGWIVAGWHPPPGLRRWMRRSMRGSGDGGDDREAPYMTDHHRDNCTATVASWSR